MKETTKFNPLKNEDLWSIWIGFAILITSLVLFFSNIPTNYKDKHQQLSKTQEKITSKIPFKTIAWYDAEDAHHQLKMESTSLGKMLKSLSTKPKTWSENPLDAFWLSHSKATQKQTKNNSKFINAKEKTQEAKTTALMKEKAAINAQFKDKNLNQAAVESISEWRKNKAIFAKVEKKQKVKSFNILPWLFHLFILFLFLFGIGAYFMGTSFLSFAKGFLLVFLLGLISYFLAAQSSMKTLGIGYAAWALILGLLISNTIGTPQWAKAGLRTEFYIKTGLILLGAEVLFSKILAIGLPGIFVAWIVTPIVLISTYWFGQKVLKISSKTLNITISADMSVCGVSAAVATAAACKAKKEELTLAIGLSMIFTSVMMIVLPMVIKATGMPEVLGGAWIGGTIDATGAVVAAGAFLGDSALNVAATIKMIQNILIGIIAFGVAIYFSSKVEKEEGTEIGIGEIWKRFPKFILGFIGASILFSLVYSFIGNDMAYSVIDKGVISSFTKNIRGWLFCLAFVSIGLATNFRELKSYFQGGKPLLLYVCGQTFNLMLTLLMAYIMFYIVFPDITKAI